MKKIGASNLVQLIKAAQESPRRRANLNLHETLPDPIQRLAIAMEPDTFIRPHRHTHTWEMLFPLKGRFAVLTFSDDGFVTDRIVLGEDIAVLEIPEGLWHSVLSLDDGAVIFEVKHGPYTPIAEKDCAKWGSVRDGLQTTNLLHWYGQAKPGDRYF